MDIIFINTHVEPLKILTSFLQYSSNQKKSKIIILDVFSVVTPESIIEELSFLSNYCQSLEIFKPIDPDDIIHFILDIKAMDKYRDTFLFVTDCPDAIPGRGLDYDYIFFLSLLKDTEVDKNLDVIVLYYIDDIDLIEKSMDILKLLPVINDYYIFNAGSNPPFFKVSPYESNPDVKE